MPRLRRPNMKTRRHRMPLDISLFNRDDVEPSFTNIVNNASQPIRSQNMRPEGERAGGDFKVSRPNRFGGRIRGFGKRKRRTAVEAPLLFELPDDRLVLPKYDTSKPYLAAVGTVVVYGTPNERAHPFSNFEYFAKLRKPNYSMSSRSTLKVTTVTETTTTKTPLGNYRQPGPAHDLDTSSGETPTATRTGPLSPSTTASTGPASSDTPMSTSTDLTDTSTSVNQTSSSLAAIPEIFVPPFPAKRPAQKRLTQMPITNYMTRKPVLTEPRLTTSSGTGSGDGPFISSGFVSSEMVSDMSMAPAEKTFIDLEQPNVQYPFTIILD